MAATPPGPIARDVVDAASRIEADVRFLADDLLEGREAGTRGHDLAALFVATRYRLMGLQPAGDDGTFHQAVPMLRATRLKEGAKLAITRGGSTTELAFQDDYLPAQTYDSDRCNIDSAPMVFAGQAVHAPELAHDDFAGVDVRGKVAVILRNAPARFPNDQRAFYADWDQKAAALEQRGAVGVVVIYDPVSEAKRPWEMGAAGWQRPGMRVLGPHGKPLDTFPGLRCIAYVRASRADAFFAGSRHDAAAVFRMFDDGALRSFDLAGTITLSSRSQLTRVNSRNVVGRIAAPANPLASEHVALTAHLDHLGVGAPRNGDPIYNGAQDNAIGIASMLEAGRLLLGNQPNLKRSLLLVATTAEEKGLLGAQYFVSHPPVPRASIVANVNLDLPLTVAEVGDVIPIGIEHSSLDLVARQAVAAAGLTLTPDPMAEEVLFIRSDQYPFVRAGIPAVFLLAGIHRKDGRDGLEVLQDFLSHTYHLPNDDLHQPIDWLGAARLAVVNHNIAYAVATQPERPTWKAGDFFGRRFGTAATTPAK
jgi:Zn-dependent M28 family amino/carboxypeptidase